MALRSPRSLRVSIRLSARPEQGLRELRGLCVRFTLSAKPYLCYNLSRSCDNHFPEPDPKNRYGEKHRPQNLQAVQKRDPQDHQTLQERNAQDL